MSERAQTNDTVAGERLLLAALDAAASLIVILTADGRLVRWNRACEELTGYTEDRLRGELALLELVPEEEHERARDALGALAEGRRLTNVEFHWRDRSGEQRLIQWSGAVLADDGRVSHVVAAGTDITERRRLEERVRHLAGHDELTGLMNRRRFEEELERHLARGRRYGMGGALLVLDLKGFRAINEDQGRRAGDRVLVSVAATLQRRLRTSDVVARLGGDEFAVLLPHASPAEADHVCTALERAIRNEVAAPGGGAVEASIGFAPCTQGVYSVDDLLSAADASMFAAKAGQPRGFRRLRGVD
jgi:diguanylate cyclase (GGDEF)-like protein/PAS domain S-box-containing protein